jgi:thiol-disulfide isomerase/thioredoxin
MRKTAVPAWRLGHIVLGYRIVKEAGLEQDAKKRHIACMNTSKSRSVWLTAAVALGLAGGVAWYGFSQNDSVSSGAAECRASSPLADTLKPLARGELAAVGVSTRPKLAPEIQFTGPSGQPMSLADFRGRTVLVNLWATWCVPCREEMPALDKLQAEFGGQDFEVVAINVDTRDPEKPKAWLQENGIHNLAYYADPGGKLLQTLQKSGHVVGLPTTMLVHDTGCEIALLKGPAEWASPDAFAFIRTALGRS